jgi:hypothetical protein
MTSPREQVQARLVEYLSDEPFWSAPYGVIAGVATLPQGGKVRNVTFGVARWLDAHATIWSVDRIDVEGHGALAYRVEGRYESVDALIEHLKEATR